MIERAYPGPAENTGERGCPIVVQVVDHGGGNSRRGSGVEWFPRSPLAALLLILLWEVAKWAVTMLVSRGWVP
jgi:hypothetical protein